MNDKNDGLSKKELKILHTINDIVQNEPKDLSFVFRSMVSASLPHSKPKGSQYHRSVNKFSISISANQDCGVPYGTYPRLILTWLATEIIKSKSRKINLGSSLSSFMKSLGLHVTGGKTGTLARFRDQIKRLFSSNISFSYEEDGKWINANISIAEEATIYWDPLSPDQIDLFQSNVLISESLYNEITKYPVFVDIRAITILKESSLALDIYFWLSYRVYALKRRTFITYDLLRLQFGSGYDDTSQSKYEFKRKFIIQLKKVIKLYPSVDIEIEEKGIVLKPNSIKIVKPSNKEKTLQLESNNNGLQDSYKPVLKFETYDKARSIVPGYDIYGVEQDWLLYWGKKGKKKLSDPDKAFLGFCKYFQQNNPKI